MPLAAPTGLVIGRRSREPAGVDHVTNPATGLFANWPTTLNYTAPLTWGNTETQNHWVRVTVTDGLLTRTTDFAKGSTSTGSIQVLLSAWTATQDQNASRTITVSVKLMSAMEESAAATASVTLSLAEEGTLTGVLAYDDDGQINLPTATGTAVTADWEVGIGSTNVGFKDYARIQYEPLPFVPEIQSQGPNDRDRIPRRAIRHGDTRVPRESLQIDVGNTPNPLPGQQTGKIGLLDGQSYRATFSAALVTRPVVTPVTIISRAPFPNVVRQYFSQWFKVQEQTTAFEYYYRTSFPPVVTDEAREAFDNTAFSYQIKASGKPTSYAATGLPTGLSLNSTTGVISGTINAGVTGDSASNRITLQATNASGTDSGTLTLVVRNPRPVVTSGNIETNVDVPINYNLTINDPFANVQPTGLTVAFGTAVPNLSFARNPSGGGGVISGTVSTAGNYSITVTATNTYGARVSTIALNVRPFSASNVSVNVLRNTPVRQQLSATHRATWEITGPTGGSSVPPGFAFEYDPPVFGTSTGPDRAFLVGTPVVSGVYTFQLRATRAGVANQTALSLVTLTVRDVPLPTVIIGGNADIIQNGVTVERGSNVSLAFTSNPAGATWEATGLPPGLTHQNGVISGVPTANGTFSVSLSAQVDGYNRGTVGIRIAVIEPPTPPTPPPPLTGTTPETRSPWLLKQWLLTDLSVYARSRVVQSTFFDEKGALRIKVGDDMSFAIMFIDQDDAVFAMQPDELKLTIRKNDNLDDLIIFKSPNPPESAQSA